MERIVVFTFATKPERGFAQYLTSCIRNGIVPRVLGMGREWQGFTSKIQLVREQLDCLEEHDFVVVTDSYDLVFQTGTEKVVRDFISYGKPLVFSSEAYPGWPNLNTILPETPSPIYRSLNAGFWVARVGDAKRIIDEAFGDNLSDSWTDDQGTFQLWLSINPDKAIVDYKNLLATTTYHPENNLGCNNRGVIFNKHTGSIPCAIHGTNGWDMGQVHEILKLSSRSDEPCYRRHQTYMLAADHPWPTVVSGIKSSNGAFFSVGNEQTFCKLSSQASVILELGSGDGLGSTKFFLDHSDALLICNDSWENGLYERFCCNLWRGRDRVVPLRMGILDGLRKVMEYGIAPDLIYVDADHSYEYMTEQLSFIREFFSKSTVFGNGFNFQSVRSAVLSFTKNHSMNPVIRGEIWMIKERLEG